MIEKTDLGAAYGHVHVNAQKLLTCIAIVGTLAFLCLSLPFGTTPTLAEYTTISEVDINFGNILLIDASWCATNIQWSHRHLIPKEYNIPA